MTASQNVFGNVFKYEADGDVFGNVFDFDAQTTASQNVFGNVFTYDTNGDVFGNVFEWDAPATAVVPTVPQFSGGVGGAGRLPWIQTPDITNGDDDELAMLIPLMMKVIIDGNSR